MRKIFLLIFILVNSAEAQFFGNFVENRMVSGAAANYLFLVDDAYLLKNAGKMPEPYLNGRRILVERSTDGLAFQTLDTLRPVSSVAELRRIWGDDMIKSMMSDSAGFGIKTEKDLLAFFQSSNQAFGYLFLFPEKLLTSLGLLYKDTKVTVGQRYKYRLQYTDRSKILSIGEVTHGTENKTLKALKLKFNPISIKAIDSLINGAWYIQPVPNKMIQHIKVYGKPTFEKDFKLIDEFTPRYLNDTLVASVYHKTRLANVMQIFLQPVDMIGNAGINSDTATLVAISKAKLPIVKNFKFRDTTDAVHLSWERLPAHSYLSGYILGKEDGNKRFQVLDTIPLNVTEYFDYDVKSGEAYNYEIQALPSPISNIVATNFTGVRVSGSHIPNDRIMAPDILSVTQVGHNFHITWLAIKDKELNSYHVLFSHDPDALEFRTLAVLKSDTTFVDTTNKGDFRHLTRYYRIQTMTYGMKYSSYGSMVSVIPKIDFELIAPKGLVIKAFENFTELSWNVEQSEENFIKGFKIYRKKENQDWILLNPKEITTRMMFQDTTAVQGFYSYRVIAVSLSDHLSPASLAQEIRLRGKSEVYMDKIGRLLVRNIPPGIELSWNTPQNVILKSIKIYRRLANDVNADFSQIAEIPASQYKYWDKEVLLGETYQYVLEPVSENGTFYKEKPVTINRILPNAN